MVAVISFCMLREGENRRVQEERERDFVTIRRCCNVSHPFVFLELFLLAVALLKYNTMHDDDQRTAIDEMDPPFYFRVPVMSYTYNLQVQGWGIGLWVV